MKAQTNDLVLRNGHVLLASGRIEAADVRVQHGQIAEIGAHLRGGRELDAQGGYILPGLIDVHTHGIGFESAGADTLHAYAQMEAAHGATTFFPTLFAAPEIEIEQMLRHRKATNDLRDLPQVGGFRLESPYLGYAGGGQSKDTAPVSAATTQALLAAGGGRVKIWDFSPELPGAIEAIADLSQRGIVCSLAHTSATIEQARAAVDAGARLVTHMFDTFVVPEMTALGVYPAGLTDYLLVEDRVVCEIIGDGLHVHPLLVEKTFRCKTTDGLAFVTDSNVGAGLPPGRYELPNNWGLAGIDGPNNGVRLVNRNMELAGSALTPMDAFRNCVRLFGKDIATASRVCSRTPARLLGLNKGEIGVGRDADLVIVTLDLALRCTIAGGNVQFDAL
jgi:N-acetylglucosamine-6-phosphate deacetylase